MSQAPLVFTDTSGQDLINFTEAGMQANASVNSGATEPTTMYAYMGWADTGNNVLKVRNAGNTAWKIVASLDTDLVLSKTALYTVLVRDMFKLVEGDTTSAAFTFTLPAVANVTEGTRVDFKNTGTGGFALTLDGSGAETINGSTTLALADGESAFLAMDGTEWRAIVSAQSTAIMGLIATATASSSSSIDFTNLSATYFKYLLVGSGIVFSATNVPNFRVSIDNGSNFISVAGSYRYAVERTGTSTTSGGSGSNSTTQMNLVSSTLLLNNDHSFEIQIINPMGASTLTQILSRFSGINSASNMLEQISVGHRKVAEANNAIRFYPSSGTITTGDFRLYGIKAA